MSQRTRIIVGVGVLVLLLSWGGAAADHLAGRYRVVSQDPRNAQMAGSVLTLQQNGRALVGEIAGSGYKALFRAETDGGNNARGLLTPEGGQRQYIEASFDQGGMRMTVVPVNGQGRLERSAATTVVFTRESGHGMPPR